MFAGQGLGPDTPDSGTIAMAGEASQILNEISAGDRSNVDQLMLLVYDDLRSLAHRQLSRDVSNTLNPTAVVHEVFIKLVDRQNIDWRGESHFYAVSAKAMRHILVDYAREKTAQKRGGDRQRIPWADDVALSAERDEDVLALDEALNVLAEINEQRALIVEMRFFAGMTIKEVSEALGIAERTIGKQWSATRLWLRKHLEEVH
jgi:RNA polymerase sigma-70 factor (ECF subfamily)